MDTEVYEVIENDDGQAAKPFLPVIPLSVFSSFLEADSLIGALRRMI